MYPNLLPFTKNWEPISRWWKICRRQNPPPSNFHFAIPTTHKCINQKSVLSSSLLQGHQSTAIIRKLRILAGSEQIAITNITACHNYDIVIASVRYVSPLFPTSRMSCIHNEWQRFGLVPIWSQILSYLSLLRFHATHPRERNYQFGDYQTRWTTSVSQRSFHIMIYKYLSSSNPR